MPKFNMSDKEAEQLVAYFAAVTRLNNIGIGLTYPHNDSPAREELSGDYWKFKNAAYVNYLKTTKAKDKDGKDTAATLYQSRIDAYTPIWEELRTAKEAEVKAGLQRVNKAIESQTKLKSAKEDALKSEKDAGKKATLQTDLDTIQASLKGMELEKAELDKSEKRWEVKAQQQHWEQNEAYASDAYRLLTSRELCTKCHQVGSFSPSEPVKVGPPLALASSRLRPDWIERWVNKPHRFVPYNSLMPAYFNKDIPQYQAIHAGPAMDQLRALSDVLANFPRVSALPINAAHNPDRPVEKK
jgi:hypothetical protein